MITCIIDKLNKKYKNASPAAKASMAFLVANLVQKGISMISGPVFTRLMPQEQYGIVSTFQSLQTLLATFITLNLNQGVFNNGMLDYKGKRDEFLFSLLSISSVISIVSTVVFQVFINNIEGYFGMPAIFIYIMMLYFLFVPAYQLWAGRQRYEFKYKILTSITMGIAVLSLLIGIVLVVNSPSDRTALARVCAIEGVQIAVGIGCYVVLAIKSRFKIKIEYCIYALKFNLPLIPHYLSLYVLASSDRIMITKMIDTAATAIYSVSYTVASVIQIIWSSIEASLSPWIYERLEIGDKQAVKRVTLQILVFFAVMCLASTLFAPEIMSILAPASYRDGIYVIPSVAGGVFFIAEYTLYIRIALFHKKIKFATLASVCAAVLNIVLNYVFIAKFGYIAAGYTTMVCYIVLTLLHYLNVKSKGIEDAINNWGVLLLSIIVTLVSGSISVLYDYWVLRYVVISMLLILFVIKRRTILGLLKK